MNPIEFLESQHREVEALFSEIEKSGDRAGKRKKQLAAELIEKLTIHTKLEEAIFYPQSESVDEDLTLESYEEHDLVKVMLKKLGKTSPSDESFMPRVTVLKEMVEHHVKEEESELFPECEKQLSEEKLEILGNKLEATFKKLNGTEHGRSKRFVGRGQDRAAA